MDESVLNLLTRSLLLLATPVLLLYGYQVTAQTADEPKEHLTGTLEGGWIGIGGDHTGWVITPELEADSRIEVDVSCCRSEAETLDGSRVSITGRWFDRQYVERGVVRILVAEEIVPAE
jgi:hypothetical protein